MLQQSSANRDETESEKISEMNYSCKREMVKIYWCVASCLHLPQDARLSSFPNQEKKQRSHPGDSRRQLGQKKKDK